MIPATRRQILVVLGISFLAMIVLIAYSQQRRNLLPKVREEATGPGWFEDVTDEVGLDFLHDAGPTGSYFMPQIVGSGGAFFDFDGDGRLDIYLLQNGGPDSKSVNRLYRQLPNGHYQDVTEGSGLGIAGYNMGVAIGDVNNDGLPDVLVTQYGGIKLFLNLGNGKFEDVTEEAGLHDRLWATSAAFFDYNRDGLLDLFVANYVDYDPGSACSTVSGVKDYCTPKTFNGTASKLFRNRTSKTTKSGAAVARVRFEDVSFDSGIGKLVGPALGVVCADFNGDGWPDIYVANDGKPNWLWINQKDGHFTEEAISRGVAFTGMGQAAANMGIAVGDVANRGMLDLYVTHLSGEGNTLWSQGPRGVFRDQSSQWGLESTQWRGTGFGTLMADFNHDGFLDIAVVNGRVYKGGSAKNTGLEPFWENYAERNQLFANDGTGKFVDVSPANKAFSGHFNVARGLACGDFDNDGSPDLLVTTISNRARLFRNVTPHQGHWLKIRAVDSEFKRDAYGAEIRVKIGNVQMLRNLNPSESYLCSSSTIVHFGLGEYTKIDLIEITWPDGAIEAFPGPEVDRLVELQKGEGRVK